jgi:hypothetical protein
VAARMFCTAEDPRLFTSSLMESPISRCS